MIWFLVALFFIVTLVLSFLIGQFFLEVVGVSLLAAIGIGVAAYMLMTFGVAAIGKLLI